MDVAGNEYTPVDALDRLAFDAHPRVRTRLSRNPNASPAALAFLARDANSVVRHRVARHPNTPYDALLPLADDPALHELVAARIAELKPEALVSDDLTRHSPPAFRRAAAKSPIAGEALVAHLACDPDPAVRTLVAQRTDAPVTVLAALSRDDDGDVRRAVAANETLDRRSFNRLARQARRDPDLARALAANRAMSRRAAFALYRTHRWDVRARLAANPNCPKGLRAQLARNPRWSVRAAAAAAVCTKPSTLRRLARADARVQLALAGNPIAPGPEMRQLLFSGNLYVRGKAAKHPAQQPADLQHFVSEMNQPPWILRNVATNPSCPAELRDQLLTWLAVGGAGAGDPNFNPDRGVGNPGTGDQDATEFYRTQTMVELAKSGDVSPLWRDRLAAITAPKRVPYSLLARSARDPRPEIRRRTAQFYTQGRVVLRELAGDEDSVVRANATRSIERAKQEPRRKRIRRALRADRRVRIVAMIGVLASLWAVGGLTGSHDAPKKITVPSIPVLTPPARTPFAKGIAQLHVEPAPLPADATMVADATTKNGVRVRVVRALTPGVTRVYLDIIAGPVPTELTATMGRTGEYEVTVLAPIALGAHEERTYELRTRAIAATASAFAAGPVMIYATAVLPNAGTTVFIPEPLVPEGSP
jgi:hypothetical protein